MSQLQISHCHGFPYDVPLTSDPLLCSVRVPGFSLHLLGGCDPVCFPTLRRSQGAAAGGPQRLRRGLRRRLAGGGVGFAAGWFMAELESAGELFVLMGRWGGGDLSGTTPPCVVTNIKT